MTQNRGAIFRHYVLPYTLIIVLEVYGLAVVYIRILVVRRSSPALDRVEKS